MTGYKTPLEKKITQNGKTVLVFHRAAWFSVGSKVEFEGVEYTITGMGKVFSTGNGKFIYGYVEAPAQQPTVEQVYRDWNSNQNSSY